MNFFNYLYFTPLKTINLKVILKPNLRQNRWVIMRNIILREMDMQFFVFDILAISVAISNFIVMVVIFNANPFCILK